MNKKIMLVILLLIGCFLIWLLIVQDRKTLTNPSKEAATSQVSTSENGPAATEPQPDLLAQNQSVSNNANRYKEADIRDYVESQNIPVEFHGKIIDQDDKPLSSVKVRTLTRHWDVVVPVPFGSQGRMITGEATTSADGCFTIQGMTGDSVSIETIEKPGYELEPTYLTYGATSGSTQSPIVFRMWDTNIHEPLISAKKAFPIIPDGRSYVVNLQKGVISELGDGSLKISIKRPESIIFGQKYDWSCRIEVLDGGLQAATNYISKYKAPADGYIPLFKQDQKVGSGWGDSTGKKEFFVKLNNGQMYGLITIELFAYYNNKSLGMVRLDYVINPSGSRILR